jgi:nucleotide-binding universal stress UspA family protein
MFRKITVAFDESPEADRALQAAVELAKSLHASLTVISVIEPAPTYFPFRLWLLPISDGLTKCEPSTSPCKRRLANLQRTQGSPSKPTSQMEMKSRASSKPQDIISLIFLLLACPNTIGSLATLRKKLQSTSLVRYWESGSYRFRPVDI